ncbi:hypothetical protein Trydic_g20028 [Trypoxylus dichotomus]
MVRALDPLKSSSSLLLASRRLERYTGEAITKIVLNTLAKFEISTNQVIIFVTDGTSTMQCAGRILKHECGNLLHVTCKIQALHLVAETIRRSYPEVDALIASTQIIFRKSPRRLREFRKQCPGIPEPPQPILTGWGKWLKALFYYAKHFQQIKSAVLQFDSTEAAPIQKSQKKFQDISVETDLKSIGDNYKGLLVAIEKLQNPSESLVDSLQIVDDVYSLLLAIGDARNDRVIRKYENLLKKDSDFITLRQISNGTSTDSLNNLKDYCNYACITSVDIEQSFSAYKEIFSSRRTSLAETSVEAYLMLQFFLRSHADSISNDAS